MPVDDIAEDEVSEQALQSNTDANLDWKLRAITPYKNRFSA